MLTLHQRGRCAKLQQRMVVVRTRQSIPACACRSACKSAYMTPGGLDVPPPHRPSGARQADPLDLRKPARNVRGNVRRTALHRRCSPYERRNSAQAAPRDSTREQGRAVQRGRQAVLPANKQPAVADTACAALAAAGWQEAGAASNKRKERHDARRRTSPLSRSCGRAVRMAAAKCLRAADPRVRPG